MKLLKFELLKTVRNKFIVFVVLSLLIANGVTAFYLCRPEHDETTADYASAVGDLLTDTEKKYSMLEDKDGFTGEYYTQIGDMYSALDTAAAPRQVSGWGQYLQYGYVNLFLLTACAFCAAFTFRREKETGEMITLYSSANGRGNYVIVKLLSSSIIVIVFVAAFCALSLLGIFAKNGFTAFTGGGARIQDLKAYMYAPYEISVFRAFLLSVAYKIPACAGVYAFCGCVAYLFDSGVVPLSFSAVLMYASYYAMGRVYTNGNAFAKNSNLFAAMRSSSLFGELRGTDVFGRCVPTYVFNAVFPALLAAAFAAVFTLLHVKRAGIKIKLPKIKPKKQKDVRPAKPLPLYVFEMKKLTKSKVTVFIIILLFIVRWGVSLVSPHFSSMDEMVYKYYCDKWQGQMTEKFEEEYLHEQRKVGAGYMLTNGYDVDESILGEFNMEPGDLEAYYRMRFEGLLMFRDKIDRLKELRERGIDAPILYDGGYKRFFDSGADIFLILAVVYICTYLFSYDFTNRMHDVVKTTYNGGKKLLKTKLLTCICLSAVLFAVFTAVSAVSTFSYFGMTEPTAPMYAVPGFEFTGSMPLWAYLLLMILVRFAGVITLCLFCCGLSLLLKNNLTSFTVSACLYVFPTFLLSGAESRIAHCADPSYMLDGSGFIQLAHSPAFFAVSVFVCVVIPLLLIIPQTVKMKGKQEI